MQNNKSVEKKLKITILSLCIAVVALVGAVIGIWAATSQGLKTSFTIDYEVGDNISARVKTEYYVPNQDADEDGVEDGAITVVKNKNGQEVEHTNGFVVFNAGEPTKTEALYIGELTLSPEAPKVIFYFTIQNLLYEDYIQTIFSTEFARKENVKVRMYYYNAKSFPYNSASKIADEDWTLIPYNNVEAQGYKCIKMEISTSDLNNIAICSGDNLLQLYHSTEAQNVSTLNKTAFRALATNSTRSIVFDYAQNNGDYATTGTDLSVEGDGSIWGYTSGATTYVISRNTILFPQDSSSMFSSLGSLTNLKLSNVNTLNVTNMSRMFAYSHVTVDVSGFDTSKVTDMSYMFGGSIKVTFTGTSNFDTSEVTTMAGMFYNAHVTQEDIANFDTSKVTDMSHMFADAYGTALDLSHFDTSSVTDMSSMFGTDYEDIGTFTSINLSTWDTSSVTDMSYMFACCEELTSLDLSHFDTSSVTDMSCMFDGCSGLTTLDVSHFDTSNTDVSYMFSGCSALTTLDVSHFDTSSVTDMSCMFDGCSGLTTLDLSSFNTSSVTRMTEMFDGCSKLTTIYVGPDWSTVKVTSSAGMFTGCTSLPNFKASYTDKTYAYAGGQGYLTLK